MGDDLMEFIAGGGAFALITLAFLIGLAVW